MRRRLASCAGRERFPASGGGGGAVAGTGRPSNRLPWRSGRRAIFSSAAYAAPSSPSTPSTPPPALYAASSAVPKVPFLLCQFVDVCD